MLHSPRLSERALCACIVLFLAFCFLAQKMSAQASAPRSRTASVEHNLVQTAISTGRFTTLVRYIKAAGLADTLSNWGPFTIFAPSDAAFARLPRRTVAALLADPARLRNLLSYHIFVGSAFKHHILELDDAIMLQGDTIKIRAVDGGALLNERTRITSWTLRATNGVIHTIDHVMLPPVRKRGVAGVAHRAQPK